MPNSYDDLIKEDTEGAQATEKVLTYDDLIKEDTSNDVSDLKQSVYVGSKQNPDQYAKAVELGKRAALPADVVSRNYQQVSEQHDSSSPDYDQIIKETPGLGKWLSKPDNASISHDDIPTLQQINKGYQQASYSKDLVNAFGTGFGSLESAAANLAVAYGKMEPEQAAEIVASLNKRNQEVAATMPDYAKEFQEAMRRHTGDVDMAFKDFLEGFAKQSSAPTLEALKQFMSGGIETVGELISTISAAIVRPKGLLRAGIENFANSIPATVLGIGGAAAGGIVGYTAGSFVGQIPVEMGDWMNQEFQAAGINTTNPDDLIRAYKNPELMGRIKSEAFRKGLGTAGVDALFNIFLGKFGESAVAGSKVSKVLRGAADVAVQASGEMASELSGQVAAKKGFEGTSAGEAVQEGILSLGHSFGEVAAKQVTSGLRTQYHIEPAKAAVEVADKTNEALKSYHGAQAMTETAQAVNESKLAKRYPDAIKDMLATASEGQEPTNIYFQTKDWEDHWNGNGLSPAQAADRIMGDGGKAYYEAKANGTQLSIPLDDYISKVATTEHFEPLLQSGRLNPEGMSLSEANQFLTELPGVISEIAKESESVGAKNAQTEEPAAKVAETVAQQLQLAGVDESTAKAYSQVYEGAFKSLGERAGVDPLELFNKYGLKINRPELQTPTNGSKFLNQVKKIIPKLGGKSLEQSNVSEPFYHNLQKTIEDKLPNSASVDQVKATIKDVQESWAKEGINNFLSEKDGVINLSKIIVPSEKRNSGIGTKAIEELIKYADSTGQKITISPSSDFGATSVPRLKKFYKKFGFVENVGKNRDFEISESMYRIPKNNRSSFDQGGDNNAIGRITFGSGRQFNIDLLKGANLSTFLHETGHFYLEVLGDLAQRKDAPAQIKKDYQTILDWMGVDSRHVEKEQHEQFARGFEAYLMEGKAPSSALRAAFARFRSWLVSIYRKIDHLNVELTKDVRSVFDRLLATEDEIKAAQAEQGMEPLFSDPASVGMSANEAASYNLAVTEARQSAEDALNEKLLKVVRREQGKEFKETRGRVEQEVKDEIDKQPVYIAQSILRRGEMPDGSPLPDELKSLSTVKLSRQDILDNFGGPSRLDSLPKPAIYTKEGGIGVEAAASIFGFNSGDEMLTAIKDSMPRNEAIQMMTDARMKQEFPDLLNDPKLSDEAMKDVHNEKRALLLRQELQYLASEKLATVKGLVLRITRKIPPTEAVRAQAERQIAEKKVRDINPNLYKRAEATAARNAVESLLRGDISKAFDFKIQEQVNFELYRAAVDAKEKAEKDVRYVNKFNKSSVRERIGKAGWDYLEQIDSFMDRFDFRPGISLKAVDRRKSLIEWRDEQILKGENPDIPIKLLNEAYRQSYKDLTVEELSGVTDSIKIIEHLARRKNELLANNKIRTLDAAREAIRSSIQEFHKITPDPVDLTHGLRERMKEGLNGLIASHTRMEFLFEYLDGNNAHGPVSQLLFQPFVNDENSENEMAHDVVKNMDSIFGKYSRHERATWFYKKILIPETKSELFSGNFTKANLLAVALNLGNEYNKDALMRSYKWGEDQIRAIVKHLDKRDWETVQSIWEYINTFWPKIEALEKSLNGIAPEKVQATPFQVSLPNGEVIDIKGGYYPIVFDSKQSWRQHSLESKENVSDMFGGAWARSATKKGHTKERTNTGGKPLRLELTGLTQHLTNVIHDLAFRKSVIDVHKIINDDGVREAIEGAAGKEMYKQLNPWLSSIAGDRRTEPMNQIEGILAKARHGATIVNLGLKFTSALVQTAGYTLTTKEIGLKYAGIGLRDTFGKPWKIGETWKFITDRSDMMKSRLENYDRDVRDATKGLNVAGVKPGTLSYAQAYAVELDHAYFYLIGQMDLATAMPTWLGAYRKAMDGGVKNIASGDQKSASEYGDQVVRQTQSAGAAKDLAGIQRGSEAFKLFTMFYSQLSLQFNQFLKTGRQFKMDGNLPRLIASLALIWFVPALLEEILRGRAPSPDDDPEKAAKWALKNEALYPFQSVIGLRDIASALDYGSFQMSPVANAFESLTKTAHAGFGVATGEKNWERTDTKNALMTAGYFAGLPTRQTWQTGEYFYDWMTGEQQPANPIEGVWRALIAGKNKN